jgi:glycosidase
MTHWALDSVFYQIYPLGLCGAPRRNDLHSPAVPRLECLYSWIDHLRHLGVNAVVLGPLFESTAHGYDTADYYWLDRRLGTNRTLKEVVAAFRENGIRVVFDVVLNHVGRDFWAFRDVRQHLQGSDYCGWFAGLNFEKHSPLNDPFGYQGWAGHFDLVKLNLSNPEAKKHIFQAVEMWLQEFGPDGFRLDAADCIDMHFLRELGSLCRSIKPDFWLMGEAVHGNYRTWTDEATLDSVTNYHCYKGLFSSHLDRNFFEIAYTLNRQFGPGGLYCNIPLYNFADNHDVNRIASMLTHPGHLYTLYCLLFTMPGVPSIYYGSEWGLEAKRTNGDDTALRPALDISTAPSASRHPDLCETIGRLANIRRACAALRYGDYVQLSVSHEQLAFARRTDDECVVVAINASDKPVSVEVAVPDAQGSHLVDLLNPGETFAMRGGRARIDPVWPCWARIMVVR